MSFFTRLLTKRLQIKKIWYDFSSEKQILKNHESKRRKVEKYFQTFNFIVSLVILYVILILDRLICFPKDTSKPVLFLTGEFSNRGTYDCHVSLISFILVIVIPSPQ